MDYSEKLTAYKLFNDIKNRIEKNVTQKTTMTVNDILIYFQRWKKSTNASLLLIDLTSFLEFRGITILDINNIAVNLNDVAKYDPLTIKEIDIKPEKLDIDTYRLIVKDFIAYINSRIEKDNINKSASMIYKRVLEYLCLKPLKDEFISNQSETSNSIKKIIDTINPYSISRKKNYFNKRLKLLLEELKVNDLTCNNGQWNGEDLELTYFLTFSKSNQIDTKQRIIKKIDSSNNNSYTNERNGNNFNLIFTAEEWIDNFKSSFEWASEVNICLQYFPNKLYEKSVYWETVNVNMSKVQQIIIGLYHYMTFPEVLTSHKLTTKLRIFENVEHIEYSNIYLFEKENNFRAIIGNFDLTTETLENDATISTMLNGTKDDHLFFKLNGYLERLKRYCWIPTNNDISLYQQKYDNLESAKDKIFTPLNK